MRRLIQRDAGSLRDVRYWPLWVRIVIFSVLLVLLLQMAGFGVIRSTIETNARRTLTEELEVGTKVWAQLLEQRAERLRQGAGVLASDYGLREALSSGDQGTVDSALENHVARIGAELAAVFDTRFATQGAMLPPGMERTTWLQAMAPQLAKAGWSVSVAQGKPYQLVMVPMKAPLTVGWVVMGFPLDDAMLRELRNITGLHATLVVHGDGSPPHALQSTLPQAQALLEAAAGGSEVRSDEGALLLRRVPVGEAAGVRIGLTLAGPLQRALAPYQALQLWLLAITAAAIGLFALLSLGMARYITRPLAALMDAAESLRRGHYDTPLAETERADEFGALATAFERMRQGIRGEMYFDQRLTQLPNRLQFHHVLDARLKEGRPVAVLMLGLNRFKLVNRVLGYEAGDRLLRGMAERLQKVVRPGDFVARLGGDVFVLLLSGADAEAALKAAARVGRELEQPLDLDDKQVDLHASAGIACAPRHADDADRLLARAEVAMYTAKDRKEAAMLYDPVFDKESAQTLSLLSELRHARENGELRLHLQPQMSLATGEITGAEALLRWEHPARGMVRPIDFIPYAEQTPIIRELTLWVFEAVVREQKSLREQGVNRISINLSARDLMDVDLPAKLDALLQPYGASPQGLCLETTESAVMDDVDRARQTLARLAERGYQLSIDDFGTGHSSMEYLKDLAVHELKIDMSFIKGMAKDPRNVSIVRAMIDVGHALGLTVVAEGIEDEGAVHQLAALGCDEGQGWYYGRPMPAGDLRGWAQAYQERLAAAAHQPGTDTTLPTRPMPLH